MFRNKYLASIVSLMMVFAFMPIHSFALDTESGPTGELTKASEPAPASQGDNGSGSDLGGTVSGEGDEELGSGDGGQPPEGGGAAPNAPRMLMAAGAPQLQVQGNGNEAKNGTTLHIDSNAEVLYDLSGGTIVVNGAVFTHTNAAKYHNSGAIPFEVKSYSVSANGHEIGTITFTNVQSGQGGAWQHHGYFTKNTPPAEEAHIVFDENGGSAVTDLHGTTGSTISNTAMPTTTKAGFTFAGWYDNAGLTGSEVTNLPAAFPAGTTTYYAKWTANPAHIVFVENGGSAVTDLDGTTGSTISNTAMPTTTKAGFTFAGWYDNAGLTGSKVTNLPTEFPAGTTTYYAKWTANPAHIVFDENGGSAVTDLDGTTGSTISNTAMPTTTKAGFTFEGWYDNAGLTGSKVTNLPTEFPAGTTTYYAKWTENSDITINYIANTGGSVSSASETLPPATGVAAGSTAKAAAGYQFVNWTNGDGVQVSTNETFIPAKIGGVNVAATYTANFANEADIIISYQATAGGSVSSLSEDLAPATGVAAGSTATADPGYHFVKWTNGAGTEVSTNAAFIPAKVDGLNVAATYTAHFKENADITINYQATAGGSVSSASETLAPATGVAAGSTATALAGYHFVKWTDRFGIEVSTDASFIPAKDGGVNVAATYTANFAQNADITINYKATTGGLVTNSRETLAPVTGHAWGSRAIAFPGYHFVNWTDEDGDEVSTNIAFRPARVGGLNVAATYTANFEENDDITIKYRATTGGSVSSASETLPPVTGVAAGSTATADPGYHFVKWTNIFGLKVSTSETFVPKKFAGVNFATTYIAHFAENDDITINYQATTGGSVSTTSEDLAPATGVAAGSTATAAAGYHFVNWTNGTGTEVSTDAEFVPAKVGGLNVAATYIAHFAENDNITINYQATAGGSVSSLSEDLAPATGVAKGSTATAKPGYHFVNWTKGDDEVSTAAKLVPEKVDGLNVAATYTANFAEDDDITINYKATTGGSVSSASEALAPATGVAKGSTATAAAGYSFVNWTNEDGVQVSTAATFVPEKVGGLNVAGTYTANFEANPVPVPPVPGPGPGPGPGPAAAGGGGAPALVAIEPAPAPAAAVEIEDQEVPKSLLDLGSWALLNLLLTILACIMSVALIITFFTRKKDEDEEEEKLKKKGVWRAISAVWGILMIIVFLVTEDMSLPMVFVDKWTIMMIIMTAIQGGVMIMSRKKYVEEDSEMA